MASTTASVGKQQEGAAVSGRQEIYGAISRLADWLEQNDCCGYDPFDGLNARFVRLLTFNRKFLRQVLIQGVRRFPLNLRPLLGIRKNRSTKGMGFLAKGSLRLYAATGDLAWREKAVSELEWLIENQSPGYGGPCWGNHFDYQARSGGIPKGVPSVVWTALIGHSFVDAYEQLGEGRFFQVAVGSCEHILRDLAKFRIGDGVCINYTPRESDLVHNANTLGASLLARVYAKTEKESYRALAENAMRYTAQHQRADGSWYYGEASNLHWVDNFHTAYVLDCFKYYGDATGDKCFEKTMIDGYTYWKNTFFLEDGTPRYYNHKTLPLDIQCCSQAIDTLVFFHDRDAESLVLAEKVARWTIAHMQHQTGYFYYRRYSRWLVNKTPTLHWGQATMFCALAGLYRALKAN